MVNSYRRKQELITIKPKAEVKKLNFYYGSSHVLKDVNLLVPEK